MDRGDAPTLWCAVQQHELGRVYIDVTVTKGAVDTADRGDPGRVAGQAKLARSRLACGGAEKGGIAVKVVGEVLVLRSAEASE